MDNDCPVNADKVTPESQSGRGRISSTVPGVWTASDVTPQEKQAWDDYWERLDDSQPIFRLEAKDFVERFNRMFTDATGARLLDFGCGFGLLAEEISSRVAELMVWDSAANMRSIAYARLSGIDNVGFVDLSDSSVDMPAGEFDFILVNSVIQYMTFDELSVWTRSWKAMLAPGGRLVISDIMTDKYSFVRDLFAFLAVCRRNGVLMRSILAGIRAIGDYSAVKASRPLLRLDAAQISTIAGGADLDVTILPENLTYHYGRITAVFQKKE